MARVHVQAQNCWKRIVKRGIVKAIHWTSDEREQVEIFYQKSRESCTRKIITLRIDMLYHTMFGYCFQCNCHSFINEIFTFALYFTQLTNTGLFGMWWYLVNRKPIKSLQLENGILGKDRNNRCFVYCVQFIVFTSLNKRKWPNSSFSLFQF